MAHSKRNGNGQVKEAVAKLENGQSELEKALRSMLQASALLQQNQAAHQVELAELRRQSDQRFARIESILLDHSRVLAELTRSMHSLPEAVREKIGFRMPPPA